MNKQKTIPFIDGDFRPISGLSYKARGSIHRIYERLEMEQKRALNEGNTIYMDIPKIKHLL